MEGEFEKEVFRKNNLALKMLDYIRSRNFYY